ncbi:hypothetical protein AHAS_Ahas16G0059600 [Arachis hypogaea]
MGRILPSFAIVVLGNGSKDAWFTSPKRNTTPVYRKSRGLLDEMNIKPQAPTPRFFYTHSTNPHNPHLFSEHGLSLAWRHRSTSVFRAAWTKTRGLGVFGATDQCTLGTCEEFLQKESYTLRVGMQLLRGKSLLEISDKVV